MRAALFLALLASGCVGPAGTDVHRRAWPRHFLTVLDALEGSATRVVRAPFGCDELVPSWNVDAPSGTGVVIELAVARGPGEWSPWLLVGTWGLDAAEVAALRAELEERTSCAEGRVEVDTFVASEPIDRARLRVRPVRGEADGIRLRRAAFCFTASTGGVRPPSPALAERVLDVPFRSQQREEPALAPRVCSPTSLAMVLAFHGLERTTAEVAGRAHDPLHDLYGNWSRAVQVAWSYGRPGHVARFSDWDEVEGALTGGTPLIASVRVDEGQLGGAPFASSEGHLLVIRGLDGKDGVLVNDPAFATEAEGRTRYSRAELETVWFRNRKGTAYVIEPAPGSAGR